MQALKNLQAHETEKFKTDAQYLTQWFDYENSPFRLFAALKLNDNIPTIQELIHVAEIVGVNVNDDDELYDKLRTLRTASDFPDNHSPSVQNVKNGTNIYKRQILPTLGKLFRLRLLSHLVMHLLKDCSAL
jgi:hypothetical protein